MSIRLELYEMNTPIVVQMQQRTPAASPINGQFECHNPRDRNACHVYGHHENRQSSMMFLPFKMPDKKTFKIYWRVSDAGCAHFVTATRALNCENNNDRYAIFLVSSRSRTTNCRPTSTPNSRIEILWRMAMMWVLFIHVKPIA